MPLRALLRAPAFTAAAVLTFGLGIGVNSAIFGAANAVLLRPLPAVDVAPLVSLETEFAGGALQHANMSPSSVWRLSDRHDVFTGLGGYRLTKVTIRDAGSTTEINAASTAGAFFEALGVRPVIGRLYGGQETEHGEQRIVVLSYDFWQTRFGGDVAVIDRTVSLNDSTYRIVAVLPAGASYPRVAALWTPRPLDPFMDLDRSVWASSILTAVARPRPGVTPEQVRAALEQSLATTRAEHPELNAWKDARYVARPLVEALAGQMRPILFAILVCGALVLLVACANVASLQLVRVSALSRELAVRAALGATRWTLALQIASESAIIAVAGGVLGLLAGWFVVGAIRRSSAGDTISLAEIRLDPAIVVGLFGLILVAGAISAMAALRTTVRVDPGDVLRASTRGASGGKARDRFLRAVVSMQIALSIVLLLGGATAARSLVRLIDVDPGFDPDGVTAVRMILPSPRYSPIPADTSMSTPTNVEIFYDQLINRLRQRPGIRAVGLVTGAPFGYVRSSEHKLFVPMPGRARSPSDPFPDFWRVSDDYFRAMAVPVRAGRVFTSTDESHRDPVVVIDDVLARKLFGEKTPIGERLPNLGRVIGVVGSVKKADLAAADAGSLYLPVSPWAANDLTLVIRSPLPMPSVVAEVRSAVQSLDPTLAIGDASSMASGIARSVAPQRFAMRIVGGFAVLTLALAIVGICGVTLYGVSQRTKEFGIRLALGATPESLRHLVLRESARLTAIGLTAGVAVYLAIGGVVSTMVFGISPRDPVTILVGVAVVALFSVFAALIPATRAAGIDPIRSLSIE